MVSVDCSKAEVAADGRTGFQDYVAPQGITKRSLLTLLLRKIDLSWLFRFRNHIS